MALSQFKLAFLSFMLLAIFTSTRSTSLRRRLSQSEDYLGGFPSSRKNSFAGESLDSNPLLSDFDFPPYDIIEPKHVRPGIRELLRRLDRDLVELERTLEPSWPKLVDPFEKITDKFEVVLRIVSLLSSVKDSSELRSAIDEVQPDVVKFQLRFGQSKPIYNAFKEIQDSSSWSSLSDAHKRIVEGQVTEAVLNGVALGGQQLKKFNEIVQELEKLFQKFSQNVLDATKKFEKLVTNKKELEGFPPSALALLAQTAISKGHKNASAESGPWIITLDSPSVNAVSLHAQNRTLREEIYRAHISLASHGDLDNTLIIDGILKLRLEQAKLLGYNNYAEVSMLTKMATIQSAENLIEKLRIASWNPAVQDLKDIKKFATEKGAVEANDLSQWDIAFWYERLRKSKFDINEEDLKPYFSLTKVMDGLFNLSKKLFDVYIEPADGLAPVWQPDVRFYLVKDALENPIAYFYFDPYSRPSEKLGGAWTSEVFFRSRLLARDGNSVRLPISIIVCNQSPPVKGMPSLMTFSEVETVFHEFGHALQQMLTTQDDGLIAGFRGIEWDAVELPSQFMKYWIYQRDTFMGIAKHFETQEPLPEKLYQNLLAAKTFFAGSTSLRQIRLASIDLELHTNYVPGGPETIYDADQRVGRKTLVIPPLLEDRFLCSFGHIFGGGYEAGYYSYKWAEVLSADAFSAFEDAGLDNDTAIKVTGKRFRDTILGLGGSEPALEVFIKFRGREPSPEALLRYEGLLPVSA